MAVVESKKHILFLIIYLLSIPLSSLRRVE